MTNPSAFNQGPIDLDSAQAARPGAKPDFKRQDSERFASAAMLAVDWFWETDVDLRFTYLSSRFEEITGISVDAVIGKTAKQAFAGSSLDADLWDLAARARAERNHFSLRWRLQRPHGGIRILQLHGVPVEDVNGNLEGFRGIGIDLTGGATGPWDPAQSERQFRDIVNCVTDIVCIVGAGGEIRFLNSAVERILGYGADELNSSPAGAHAVEEDRARVQHAMREALDNPGRVVAGTYRYRHKDGSIKVLQMTRQCVEHPEAGEDRSLIVHARDITDQYLAEEALRLSEDRLRDFAETGADWFWEQDAELRFTYLSGNFPGAPDLQAEQIIGKRREEIAGGNNFKSEKWQQLFAALERREAFYNFEYRLARTDGSDIVVRISGKPKFDRDGEFVGYRGTGIDITESYLLSQQLNYQASHDPLTGLVNRREFEIRLARVVKSCRDDNGEHALCYIDLDQFKVVNDTCGHDAGDELLRQVSALLADKVRQRDTIARLGGDEFGLLLERCTLKQANRVAETVREAIEQFRFMWAGRNFRLGASIGVIPIDFRSGNIGNVMRSADAACYAAKDAGRNRIHVYSEDNIEVAQRHQEMQRIVEINHAFDEQRFVIYQQQIKPLDESLDDGGYFCEVLVRMVDEFGFHVVPANFLATAERYNLATQLDTWVVNAALDWLAANPGIRCTVNLSGRSVADDNFLRFVLEALESHAIDAARLCLEITETAAIQNLSKANHFIAQLRGRGCRFALDDFGSGLSSFAYLKTLPVDFLKIDGFFVRDMVEDRINFELVKSINDIAHVMGKRTIAEFVENDDTMAALQAIGIDYAQGYGIAMPEPVRSLPAAPGTR